MTEPPETRRNGAAEANPGAGAGNVAERRGARLAILLALIAIGLFCSMDAAMKWLAASYSPVQIILFQAVFAALPLSAVLLRSASQAVRLSRADIPVLLAIGALNVGALFAFIHAFRLIPLAEAYAISFSAPLFVALLSAALLKERPKWSEWLAIILGFGGVLVVLRPGAAVFEFGAVVCLAATLLYAGLLIAMRKAAQTLVGTTIVTFQIGSKLAFGLAGAPLIWQTPPLADLGLLALVGILSGAAQLLLATALRFAPAHVVSVFDYTALLWGVLYGAMIWGDIPAPYTLLGAAIVIASGIWVYWQRS